MKVNIGIKEDARLEVAGELGKVLADTYVLYLKTHGYHWNVTGPFFSTLHALFQEQYTELWQATDEVAERIRALGEFAPATYSEYAKLSTIREDDGVPPATEMIEKLVEGHEAVVRTIRTALPKAEASGDESSVDLLVQRLQVHEKTAWMLRSHLAA